MSHQVTVVKSGNLSPWTVQAATPHVDISQQVQGSKLSNFLAVQSRAGWQCKGMAIECLA